MIKNDLKGLVSELKEKILCLEKHDFNYAFAFALSSNAKLKRENDELKREIEQLKKKNAYLEGAMNDRDAINDELLNIQFCNASLSGTLSDAKSEIEKLKEEKDDYCSFCRAFLTGELSDAKFEIDKLKKEKDILSTREGRPECQQSVL